MSRTFVYKARDLSGRLETGSIIAENRAAVAAHIRARGHFVTQITERRSQFSLDAVREAIQPVGLKDLAVFSRQFATMVGAGMPFITCLNVLCEQASNSNLKAALQDVYKKVKEGESLTKAMSSHPKVFPELMLSMVEAGEAGGILEEVLGNLATYFEKEYKLKEKVKSAMTYPVIVVVVSVIIVTLILMFILPQFTGMLNSMGVELPLFTRILLAVSGFLQQYWWVLIFVLAGAGAGLMILNRRPGFREKVDRIVLKLPVFGMLARKVAIARFARTQSMLLRNGMPIITALEVVKKVTVNASMIKALNATQTSVREGVGLAATLGKSNLFTPMLVQMVAVGEETGELDKMLEKLAEFYESDVDDMAERLSSLLQPVIILVLGAIVGMIVIAIFLPMFEVINHMGR